MKQIPPIVLVEDDPDYAEVVCELLKDAGHLVTVARHGRDALELIEKLDVAPSAVLLDLHLPVMSGEELIRALRSHPRWKQIPLIVLTGSTLRPSSLAVEATLVKPFSREELLAVLDRLL